MAATTVFLTRHGQTEWNVQDRMQGQLDSALTPLGVLPYINPTCLCKLEFTDGKAEILLHGDTSHYENDESWMES